MDFSGQISEKFRFFQVISLKTSIFKVKFPKNFDILRQFSKISRFSREISEKFRFFQELSQKNQFFGAHLRRISTFRQFHKKFRFSRQISQKYRFSRQQLAICSYFWANYSISLQKSPLSNILPVHDNI